MTEGRRDTIGRVVALDQARGLALLAMAIYHLCFDLEMFGWLPPGTALGQPLRGFAVLIASSFLCLAGIGLVLAHGTQIRWLAFWRRFWRVAGAAALVSLVTWFWVPQGFVYFGILHAIALFSLLGLALVRWPVWALLVLGLAVLAAPRIWGFSAFDSRFLAWTGLAEAPPYSIDFEPVLPWMSALILGLILGRLGLQSGLWARMAARPAGPWAMRLARPGRHSLAIYLLHQPVLIGVISSVTWLLR